MVGAHDESSRNNTHISFRTSKFCTLPPFFCTNAFTKNVVTASLVYRCFAFVFTTTPPFSIGLWPSSYFDV